MKQLITNNNLPFLERPNQMESILGKALIKKLTAKFGLELDPRFKQYKIGTVHGLYSFYKGRVEILVIMNDEPGNGHFEDTMQWFEHIAKETKRDIVFLEVWNENFEKHLIKKRYFIKKDDVLIKYFS